MTMRFHITNEFAAAETAWREAYAAHDAFAEAGDDGVHSGGTEEATAASKEEYRTLNVLTHFPACTPIEVDRKLQVITSERLRELILDDLESEIAQIRRDLLNLQRPPVSPKMASAFNAFIAAETTATGDDDDALFSAAIEAETALYAVPCTTPGDFMVKAYVNLLGTNGHAEGKPLVPAVSDAGPMDRTAEEAVIRDLSDCDLGRCLMVLGRTDFDAAAWIAAAKAAGHGFTVMVKQDGKKSFVQDADANDLLALLAFDPTRNGLVAAEILANHPDHVLAYNDPAYAG
jgi:hypothetical protein